MTYLVVLVIGALILMDGDLIVPAFKNHIKRVVWGDPEEIIEKHKYQWNEEKRIDRIHNTYLNESKVLSDIFNVVFPPKRENAPMAEWFEDGACDTIWINTGTYKAPNYTKVSNKPRINKNKKK